MSHTRHGLALSLLATCSLAYAAQKPDHGKVQIHVSFDTRAGNQGLQQRASELEESARDLRKHLHKQKWIDLTEDIGEADIRFRVVARRKDAEKGYVLRYLLESGDFRTEDEFAYEGEALATGGTRSLSYDGFDNSKSGRQILRWGELAKHLAASLNGFAESNYQRIIARRPPR